MPFADVGGPTVGFVAIGVSAFALLASGPRLLGHDEYSSLAIAWTVSHSKLGLGLYAISDDEDVAEVKGVPTFRYKMIAFALSSGIAGAVGGVHSIYVGFLTEQLRTGRMLYKAPLGEVKTTSTWRPSSAVIASPPPR